VFFEVIFGKKVKAAAAASEQVGQLVVCVIVHQMFLQLM